VISGIVTAILIAAFVGIFLWAWAPRRKQAFSKAAALPLVEDVPARRAMNNEVQP
jgi:cytochrome c oxidase cbb3-type subunit 4